MVEEPQRSQIALQAHGNLAIVTVIEIPGLPSRTALETRIGQTGIVERENSFLVIAGPLSLEIHVLTVPVIGQLHHHVLDEILESRFLP